MAATRAKSKPDYPQVVGGSSYPWAENPRLVGRRLVSHVDKSIVWNKPRSRAAALRENRDHAKAAARVMSIPKAEWRPLPDPPQQFRPTYGCQGELYWVPQAQITVDDLFDELLDNTSAGRTMSMQDIVPPKREVASSPAPVAASPPPDRREVLSLLKARGNLQCSDALLRATHSASFRAK